MDLSANKKYQMAESIIKMNAYLRNTISKLYYTVSAPVVAKLEKPAERLQSVLWIASL